MLVLTRKINESIVLKVGDTEAVVKVVSVREGRIQLGIAAPPGVSVVRSELRRD